MGPGVPASGLYRGRVFKGPLPAEVDKILKENPWMKDLFVEPKDVAKAQQDLTIKSTLIHKLAGKVIEMRGGSGA
jgi:hypothetical protein